MTPVRFGAEQLIHGFELDDKTMNLMAEQGTFFTPTIGFLPTWYATYPPEESEANAKFPGDTVVERELQRTYANLRRANELGVTLTIGSDSFSFVTPYGYVTIDEMYDFVDKAGIPVLETIKAATLNGAKMVHHEDEFGSARGRQARRPARRSRRRGPQHPRPHAREHGRHHEGGRQGHQGRPVASRFSGRRRQPPSPAAPAMVGAAPHPSRSRAFGSPSRKRLRRGASMWVERALRRGPAGRFRCDGGVWIPAFRRSARSRLPPGLAACLAPPRSLAWRSRR